MAKNKYGWPLRPAPAPKKMQRNRFNTAVHLRYRIGDYALNGTMTECGVTQVPDNGVLLTTDDIGSVTCFLCKPYRHKYND